MLTGLIVEHTINGYLVNFKRSRADPVSPNESIDAAQQQLDRSAKRSPQIVIEMHADQKPDGNDRAFSQDFYGESIDPMVIANCHAKIERCISNWHEGDIWARLRSVPAKDWKLILHPQSSARDFNKWKLGMHTIYSPIDFYWRDCDQLNILDWKTGLGGDHAQQLAVYALFGINHLRYPRDNITVQPVELLQSGNLSPRQVSQLEADAIEEHIVSECMNEQSNLRAEQRTEGPVHLADIASFEPSPLPSICKRCNYRFICPDKSC